MLGVRIRVKSDGRPLLKLTANLLILAGTASLLVFAWAMLDGAYYQYTQKLQFEKDVAGGDPGIAKEISVAGGKADSVRRLGSERDLQVSLTALAFRSHCLNLIRSASGFRSSAVLGFTVNGSKNGE